MKVTAILIATLLAASSGCQIAGGMLDFITQLGTTEAEKQGHAMDAVASDPNHRTIPDY